MGGHLTALRRTAVGPYGLDVARTLDELADRFEVLPIADRRARGVPVASTSTTQAARDVRVGRPLDLALAELTALFAPDGDFLALAIRERPGSGTGPPSGSVDPWWLANRSGPASDVESEPPSASCCG